MRLIPQCGVCAVGPIALPVSRSIDRNDPVIATQQTEAFEVKIVDTSGISMNQHDHGPGASLDVTYSTFLDVYEMLYRLFALSICRTRDSDTCPATQKS